MKKETEEMFMIIANQLVSLVDCNNKLLFENLRLMKKIKELEDGKKIKSC